MVTQLSIAVANVANLLGLGYSRLEIWQSLDAETPYQRLPLPNRSTGQGYLFCSLYDVSDGRTFLKFIVSGRAEESVTFDPILVDWTALYRLQGYQCRPYRAGLGSG